MTHLTHTPGRLRGPLRVALLSCAMLLAVPASHAADHIDSPAAVAEPLADIADFYAWTSSDGASVNLALTVAPFSTADTRWSKAVQYVFHLNSATGYGEAATETLVVCQFYAADGLECWVDGGGYVAGDASDPAGIASEDGMVRAFAGLRNDPFFFNLSGFTATVGAVVSAAGGLDFDGAGCPLLDEATATALATQLATEPDGGPPVDDLAGTNVMALVLQIDKSLVNAGGPVIGTWVSTHAAASN